MNRSINLCNIDRLHIAQPTFISDGGTKQVNDIIPTERTELMDKQERDSSVMKSDDARSHTSGASSHQSLYSHHSNRQRIYDKLSFPRHDLQTLGMLGKQ